MRQLLIVGNWKMNGSKAMIHELLAGLKSGVSGVSADVRLVVCPPAVYAMSVAVALEGSGVGVGLQNVCAEQVVAGAYTGETSAAMAADLGCRYVIVGHSERRALYGESDAIVAQKVANVQAAGLLPVLCVGETLAEREAGVTTEVVGRQLQAVFECIGSGVANVIVAYEPVWAIGTGLSASPEQAQEVHAFVRQWLCGAVGGEAAERVSVLYGGSVKAANARELFEQVDVDGALVGGASLVADEFLAIAKAIG